MRAFLLAAGLGKRLNPITLALPKPLIEVSGRSLIEWHIDKLVAAGITDLLINCHWQAEKLKAALGDGSARGVHIRWCDEPLLLETGGALHAVASDLGDDPFLLISADIWTDIDFATLPRVLAPAEAAHLVLVNNPAHHLRGDFVLGANGQVGLLAADAPSLTYSGVAVIAPGWVQGWKPASKVFPLVEPLREAVRAGSVSGALHPGRWTDVGTIERLRELRAELE